MDYLEFEKAFRESGIDEDLMRIRWVPFTDASGFVLGIAWKPDEATIFQLYEAVYPEAGTC